LGRSGQRPELSQATSMALVRCILGKFLGGVCHCFPPRLDVPTFDTRCLHVRHDARDPSGRSCNSGREFCPVSGDICLGKCDKRFPLNLRQCLTVSPEHFQMIVNLYERICWHRNCCLHDINSGFVFVATFLIRCAAISTLYTRLLWKMAPAKSPSFLCWRRKFEKFYLFEKKTNI